MAFILLLLISLSTLARVESQSSKVQRDTLLARQNALLGVKVAVGNLQKYAGNDQRVTARADILQAPAADWVGLRPDIQNPDWTGVWLQNPADPTRDPANGDLLYPDPDPQLRMWLVSGMDGINPSQVNLLNEVTADLQRNDANFDFLRNGLVQILTPDVNNLGGVAVPLVEFDNAGNFGYWVSDESVKADISRVDEYEGSALANADGRVRVTAAQRVGAERIGVQAGDGGDAFGTLYEPLVNDERLKTAFTTSDVISIAAPGVSTQLEQYLRRQVHDVTANTLGLQVNAWQGGLKTDLTRGLGNQQLTGDIRTDFSPVWDDKPIPQWQLLASFNDSYLNGINGVLPVRPGTDTQNGYSPIMLHFNMLNGIYLDPIGPNAATGENEYQMYAIIWAGFALWNPYNLPLQATNYMIDFNPIAYSAEYSLGALPATEGLGPGREIRFGFGANARFARGKTLGYQGPGEAATIDERDGERIRVATENPVGFQAGELKVFSTQPIGDYLVGIDNDELYDDLEDGAKMLREGYVEEDFILLRVGHVSGQPTWRGMGQWDVNGDGTISTSAVPHPVTGKLITENAWDGVLSESDLNQDIYFRQGGNPGAALLLPDGEKLNSITSGYGYGWNGAGNQRRLLTAGDYIGMYGCYSFVTNPKRNNTYRIFADMNLRGNSPLYLVGRREDGNPLSFPGGINWSSNPNAEGIQGWVPSGGGVNSRWGLSEAEFRGGQENVVLFDVPRTPLVSLGQLKHLDFRPGWYQSPIGSSQALAADRYERPDSQVPTYQFGNSRANMWTEVDRKDFVFRLNETLWDQYFFSSLPNNPNDWSDPFVNKRMRLIDFDENTDDVLARDRDSAAYKVGVAGAFNVNSTSVEAWKAMLASLGGFINDPDSGGDLIAPFPGGFDANTLSGLESGNLDASNFERVFEGFRGLSEDELDALAERLVEEIKVRGPFLSLSQFVNRTLSDQDTRSRVSGNAGGLNHGRWLVDQRDTRLKGTLQAAIDAADHDDDTRPDINELTRVVTADAAFGSLYGSVAGLPVAQGIVSSDTMGTSPQQNGSASTHPFDDRINRPRDNFAGFSRNSDDIEENPWVAGYGLTNTDAPGFVSQMDILTALAPSLTVRGDTFKVRAYGSAFSAISGDVNGEAVLEAVVQRTPEYLDPSDAAADPQAEDVSNLNQDNRDWGRRFKIISMRWLDASEV